MIILLLILQIPALFSAVNVAAYGEYCPSTTCGSITISYPFYHIPTSSSIPICGYFGLGLTCYSSNSTDPTMILTLPINEKSSYIVKNISYASHTVTLIDSDVFYSQVNCPRVRQNLTIGDFTLTNQMVDLDFYFNCSGVKESIRAIECLTEVTEVEDEVVRNKSYVFVAGKEPVDVDWKSVCMEKVVAPAVVEENVDKEVLVRRIWEVMSLGFVLNWGMEGAVSVQCRKCENSGGNCGYRSADAAGSGKFVCYCDGGRVAAEKCKHEKMGVRKKLIIAFSVCGGTALIMAAIFFFYQRRKKTNYAPSSYFTRNVSSDPSSMDDPENMGALYGVKFFTYDELEEATDSFNDIREIGDGGFGTVYLGKLKDGRTVAVKRLYENNYKRVEQFLNEVEILTRLRHKNLVMLYGCTSRHSRELLLVYEYVSNGTVADHVHGRNGKPGSLPWETRLKIAVETASALKYLHATDIIHRDVKTNNILLDDNFSVKVADFGLSRLFPLDVTHVSTAPQGTPGYVDPEYHQCYQLTDKSDVYSFGVVLVELISSKPAVDITRHRHEINLSNMAINKIQSGSLQELVDPTLGFDKDCNVHKSITAVAELAFQCLQSEKDMRPTMQEVLEILTRIQCGDSHIEDKAEELDIFSDEFVLLKSGPLPPSPDSVTVKWVGGSVASNSSG